jgi:hypothetical protein
MVKAAPRFRGLPTWAAPTAQELATEGGYRMMFKKDMTPLTKNGDLVKHRGKGSSEQTTAFPGMHAEVRPGDPLNRVRQDYSKSSGFPAAPMSITVAVLETKKS